MAALLGYALSGYSRKYAVWSEKSCEARAVRRVTVAAIALAALMLRTSFVCAAGGAERVRRTLPVKSTSARDDPRALYQALNELRPDGEHVYTVQELNLRRDVVNVRLIEGKLAFFQPIAGHVTGAVFTGRGHIFATPRDRENGNRSHNSWEFRWWGRISRGRTSDSRMRLRRRSGSN